MNNEEAKFILQGYRPNGADAGDAAFRAALEQVQRDPALREWFARQQAFDAAVSTKLDAVPAPVGLREAILAGGRRVVPGGVELRQQGRQAEQARRAADEAHCPLARYREQELARMHRNFYGFDPSYHVARHHFVHKLPHAWTPRHLAIHR